MISSMHATFFSTLVFIFMVSGVVSGERHTITFDNQCGHGTPQLIQQGNILSTGKPFTSNGPFISGIAYLQTGSCLLNGEGCSLVEMTLINPTCPGCGSSTDISLIPPHAFSVPVSFSYSGGCSGQGATCTTPTCKTAFFVPDDNQVQVECQDEDVDLLITFCPGATGGGTSPEISTSSNVKPVSTKAPISSSTTSVAAAPLAAVPTAAAAASSASQTADVSSSADSEPESLPANAPKCSTKRSARRRRSVPVDTPTKRHRRGNVRMAHSHHVVHGGSPKDF